MDGTVVSWWVLLLAVLTPAKGDARMNYNKEYWKLRQRIDEMIETQNNDILIAEQAGEVDARAIDRKIILESLLR